jgi:hypothetical protein
MKKELAYERDEIGKREMKLRAVIYLVEVRAKRTMTVRRLLSLL